MIWERVQGSKLSFGLGAVRKKVGHVYGCVGILILPRGLEKWSGAKAVTRKGIAVTQIRQNRGMFGHFCGLGKFHNFVYVQTWLQWFCILSWSFMAPERPDLMLVFCEIVYVQQNLKALLCVPGWFLAVGLLIISNFIFSLVN